MKREYLNFTKHKTIEIAEEVLPERLKSDEVAGRTLFSLISAGTELAAGYLDVFDWGYPKKTGYASVFKVEEKGADVKGIDIGDIVFTTEAHQSYQRVKAINTVRIPDSVRPEQALFIRMAGVSMATLSKTSVKPGEKLLVTGLGAVGFLALQVYSNLGYDVIGVDPNPERIQMIRAMGFDNVCTSISSDDERYAKKIGLALECSGNEGAVLNCCNMVRPLGEVSVVGVPWKRNTDMYAHELLHSIFYNYVRLYSGWEMNLPVESSEFVYESMNKNYRLALKMLAAGKIVVDGMYTIKPYTDAQKAYDDIYNKKEKALSTIFKWN